MASQRLMIAKIGGRSSVVIAELFRHWQPSPRDSSASEELCRAIDTFCDQLRAHAHVPPIVYFAEWVDMWSMGDMLPGLNQRAEVISGNRYQASCHQLPIQFKAEKNAPQESRWLKRRLEEAEDSWKPVVNEAVIVIMRDPLGGLVSDDEIEASLNEVPHWLQSVMSLGK